MADQVVPEKKLKQARLSFGKITTPKIDSGNKENISIKKLPGEIPTEDSDKTCDVTFKSISRKQKKHFQSSNVLEVKADVHQTIQCPEISTSSIESELNKTGATEMIILSSESEDEIENKEIATENTKLSVEAAKNIDNVIESVIKRSLVDGESMILNRDLVRDRKKRNRTPSPNNLTVPDGNNGVVSKTPSGSIVNTTVSTTPSPGEQKSKKPRRSIIDMWSGAKKPLADETTTKVKTSACAIDRVKDQRDVVELHDDSIEMESDQTKNSFPVDATRKRPHSTSPVPLSHCTEEGHHNSNNTSDDDEKPLVEMVNENNAKKPKRFFSEEQAPNSPNPNVVKATETLKPDLSPPAKSPTSRGNSDDINKPSPTSETPPSASKSKKSGRLSAQAQQTKEEKERLKEEKRRLKEEEKLAREMEKQENKRKKELQREEEKKKKREEMEKLRDEKLKKKQEEQEKKKAELEAKKLEKERKDKEKEEEKRAKEQERQRILQEKEKLDDEKKRISEKQATTFKSFFTSPARSPAVQKSTEKVVGSFVPFQLKEDMFLSPKHKQLNSSMSSALDCHIQDQAHTHSYLSEVKKSGAKRHRSRTLPKNNKKMLSLSDDGLEVLQASVETRPLNIRAKLLQFSENNRPPYYGTWRKRSKILSSRNPLKQDKSLFDYDVDSDDEWEDPGEGEDIANSDGEEEGEKDDEDEEGDGFFVPHGYLSDDEGINEGEDDVEEELSDQKLKMKQQEFENSFKQKIRVMTPLTVGCIWADSDQASAAEHLKMLQKYKIQFFISAPIDLDEKKPVKASDETSKAKSDKSNSSLKKSVPEEAIPDLVRLLHGNPHRLGKLIPEFQYYWQRKNMSTIKEPAPSNNAGSPSVKASDDRLQIENPRNQSPIAPCGSVLNRSPQPKSSPYGVSGLSMVAQTDKGPFWISKAQIKEKIRGIGIYGRKEKLSRACWFVLDQVFEKYSLKQSDFPVPCKWEHVTFEADFKLYPSEVVQAPTNAPPPSQNEISMKCSIDKFATKVSAEDLLEKSSSRIKLEKEKQALQTQAAQAVDKFTTSKITPEQLLEISRQKLEQEQKQKRRISLTTVSLVGDGELPGSEAEIPASEAASFGVPTHAAFKSFFNVKKNDGPSVISSAVAKDGSRTSQTNSSVGSSCPEQTSADDSMKPSEKPDFAKLSSDPEDKEKDVEEQASDPPTEAMDVTPLQRKKTTQDSSVVV